MKKYSHAVIRLPTGSAIYTTSEKAKLLAEILAEDCLFAYTQYTDDAKRLTAELSGLQERTDATQLTFLYFTPVKSEIEQFEGETV